jgi:phospholipase C
MDGFLRSGKNDEYSIGFYQECDRPFYSALARNYTTLDRYFCSILGPTFPNRFFMHAAQTDRLSNTADLATMRTIWDNLAEAGSSGLYYYSNFPFLALWGARYLDIRRSYEQFKDDAKQGRLPAVSFLDPTYTFGNVPGNDDHPHADIRRGDAFLSEAFHAVATGPDWASTVFVVNYDEWGGFYEHVAPPRAAAPNDVDPDLVDGRALLGFRVPTVVASPFSAGDPLDPSVDSTVFDHTSVLKLIEWRWKLPPLTARDESEDVGNLVAALDFDNPRIEVPDLPLYEGPPPMPCGPPAPGEGENHWARLARSGLFDGWALPSASK